MTLAVDDKARRGTGDRRDGDGRLDHDQAKALARSSDPEVRRRLAERGDVLPEILYYLAEDDSPAVRRGIAANAAAPRHADRLLAEDVDDEVRCDLAQKIARLIPRISEAENDRLQELTFETLDVLARDRLPQVRHIVAEEIKNCISAPRRVVRRLARDVELIVAAPILEYSPLLSDDDLREIIDNTPIDGAVSAISRRTPVNAPVADAIAAGDDREAIATLLANPSAQIREETLDSLIERAAEIEIWHEPMVGRPDLSVRAVRRISNFVALSLLRVLEERHDLPGEAIAEVRRAVARRIEEAGVDGDIDARREARMAFDDGLLDDEAILAAINRGDRDFVVEALALMATAAPTKVKSVVGDKQPKSITALAWAAGLGMRTAMEIQLRVAKIPATAVLHAKDGLDYPMSEAELIWHANLIRE